VSAGPSILSEVSIRPLISLLPSPNVRSTREPQSGIVNGSITLEAIRSCWAAPAQISLAAVRWEATAGRGAAVENFFNRRTNVKRPSCTSLLLTLCTLLPVPAFAQDGAVRPPQNVAEIQKLDTMLALIRQRNARDYAITTPNGIDESRYVAIGGLEQWITVRSDDRRNPVLLFLHGGPGDATNPWGWSTTASS
jgi:hypothetical protein